MKYGLSGMQAGLGSEPDGLPHVARLAEDLGFESLWTPEHIVIPERVESRYPFNKEGKLRNDPTTPRPDSLIWHAFAAAATTRIKLGTGILMLPLRNPLLLAKELATLDRLSGGRVVLGVGLGWMREEYELLNSEWSDRGRRLEEYIGVLRALWRPGARSFSGETVSFEDIHCSPTPLQESIPVVVSGTSEAAARRAGRIGDGYFPMAVSSDRLRELISVARREAERVGRDPEALEISYLGFADTDAIAEVTKAGVQRYIVLEQAVDFVREPDKLKKLADQLGVEPTGS